MKEWKITDEATNEVITVKADTLMEALQKATNYWAEKEKKQLTNRSKYAIMISR